MNDQDLIRQAIHLGIFSTPLTKDVRAFVQNFVARADPAGRIIDNDRPTAASLAALSKKYAQKPPRS